MYGVTIISMMQMYGHLEISKRVHTSKMSFHNSRQSRIIYDENNLWGRSWLDKQPWLMVCMDLLRSVSNALYFYDTSVYPDIQNCSTLNIAIGAFLSNPTQVTEFYWKDKAYSSYFSIGIFRNYMYLILENETDASITLGTNIPPLVIPLYMHIERLFYSNSDKPLWRFLASGVYITFIVV